MLYWLILLFTLVPATELVLLLFLGREIGIVPTLSIILVTGVLGGLLAKSQGLRVLRSIQADIAAGRVPSYGLVDALLILVGGALLLTPGVLTDLMGLALLFPPSREFVKRVVRRKLEGAVRRGSLRVVRM